MIRRLIILLLIVGCEETTAPTPTHGCLDGQATNYDATASIDNNTCTYIDSCGVIDIDLTNDCTQDDCGVWGGDGVDADSDSICDDVDDCIVQNGVSQECGCNTGIASGKCDCDGNTLDCLNVCGGGAQLDDCGICEGDDTSCYGGCTDTNACNYDVTADIDDNSCWFASYGCACENGQGVFVDCLGICDVDQSNDLPHNKMMVTVI